MKAPDKIRFIWISVLIGFLLNLTGWIGNNLILGSMWSEIRITIENEAWRNSIWRHIFSFVPDFIYGFGIVWLILILNKKSGYHFNNSIKAGLYVSIIGGITTYFALANSGFIPWNLAFASFLLVLLTKIVLAVFGGKLLYK